MKKPKKDLYILTLDIDGEKIKSEGESLHEALRAMKKPTKMTSKAMLGIKHGRYHFEKMYMPPQLKRLFFPIAQFFLAKQLEFLLK